MPLLTERYAPQIAGVLSCSDRLVITGTLPGGCFPEGMATHLRVHGVRLFDYPHFVLPGTYEDDLGNDFHTRIEGTRIKHHMGPVALKLYDKQALVLRIETTVNDVSFFRHHHEVEHRDGTKETKLAPMQKTSYSLAPLRE